MPCGVDKKLGPKLKSPFQISILATAQCQTSAFLVLRHGQVTAVPGPSVQPGRPTAAGIPGPGKVG